MTAVPAPPETPAEPVEPVAPPETPPASPPPSTTVGDAEQDDGEREPDLSALKGLSEAQLEAVLEAADPEARDRVVGKYETAGEQRARTRKQEMDGAKTSRLGLWKPYVDNLPAAKGYVDGTLARVKAGDFDALDPKVLEAAIRDAGFGATGQILLENEAYVDTVLDTFLPDMTPEETQALDKPLYEFARTGMAGKVMPVLMELALKRAKAEGVAEGIKKGLSDKQAKQELAEKLEKIETIRKEAPGVIPNGKAPTSQSQRDTYSRAVAQFKQDVNSGRLSQSEIAARNTELDAMHAKLPRS